MKKARKVTSGLLVVALSVLAQSGLSAAPLKGDDSYQPLITKAVTIRVPGESFIEVGVRVDVLLTRTKADSSRTTEIVVHRVRVIMISQDDERAGKISASKSVTLELSALDAQKVWLATSIGTLSLGLSKEQ